MNFKPKMRIFTTLLSAALLGISQPAMPMPTEATPLSTSAQPLTQEEMEFLIGETHRHHGRHITLTYLGQQEMAETEGKVAPVALLVIKTAIGAAGGAGSSIALDISQGNEINPKNAIISGIAGAWTGATNGLASASGVGQIGAEAIGALSGIATLLWGGVACSSCHSARN